MAPLDQVDHFVKGQRRSPFSAAAAGEHPRRPRGPVETPGGRTYIARGLGGVNEKRFEEETLNLIRQKRAEGTPITFADVSLTAARIGVPVVIFVLWTRYGMHMSWSDIAQYWLRQLGINAIFTYFNLPWFTPIPCPRVRVTDRVCLPSRVRRGGSSATCRTRSNRPILRRWSRWDRGVQAVTMVTMVTTVATVTTVTTTATATTATTALAPVVHQFWGCLQLASQPTFWSHAGS